ncbi:uncharacterized protein V1513DRAFT_435823 [Lipomyces chichibuensis]|uniref:uncharacterized protein n=1 Tax=Lipomyces chichibuensis TaxID=1546026 RepID=UPI0033438312
MPPIRTGDRVLLPDECPIPNCNSGRLQSITRAGQHFATKRHRDLVGKLKQSGDARYREVFLTWARDMNYISVINEIPPRNPLQPLSPNTPSNSKRNNLLYSKSLSSPQLKPPATRESRQTKLVHASLSRTKSMNAADNSRITWLPPVVVNPVQAHPLSSSIPSAEKQEPRVIRWATSAAPPRRIYDTPLQPWSESFYYYDVEKDPATIFRGTTNFWCDGVPTVISPPALAPASLIPPINHDPAAPGYIFAPIIPNSPSSSPVSHTIPSLIQPLPNITQRNDPSSDATVLEDDCEEIEESLRPGNIDRKLSVADRAQTVSPVNSQSSDATILSPSTIPDDQHMDSEHESEFVSTSVDEPITLNHGAVGAEQTLLTPGNSDIPLYFHPLLAPQSSHSRTGLSAPIIGSLWEAQFHPRLMTFSAPSPSSMQVISPTSDAPVIHPRPQHTVVAVSDRSSDINDENDRQQVVRHGIHESQHEHDHDSEFGSRSGMQCRIGQVCFFRHLLMVC